MSQNQFSKAPISELIFGIVFNSNLLIKNGIIFDLIKEFLNEDYPNILTLPSAADEDFVENSMKVSIDYEKSGFTLYRLFSKDCARLGRPCNRHRQTNRQLPRFAL